MNEENVRGFRLGGELVELIFWVLIGLLVFSAVGLFWALWVMGIDVLHNPEILMSGEPSARRALILTQTLSSIGTFVFPPIVWAYRRGKIGDILALSRGISTSEILNGILLMVVAIPALNALVFFFQSIDYPDVFNSWLELSERNDRLVEQFIDMKGYGDLAINLFVMALLPAVGEELLFRGAIQPTLAKKVPLHAAIWITALLFGAMHQNLINLVPLTLLGGMIGYLRVWSGSLWLPILAHYTNNSLLLIFTFMMQQNDISEEVLNQVGTPGSGGFLAIFSVLLVAFNLWLLKRSGEARNRQ